MSGYRSWPTAPRQMAEAVDAAVTAAQAGDAEAFGQAATGLARLDREQLAVLLADITRELIERAHPDGLGSEDAEKLLHSCIRASAPWFSDLDTDALIRALTGALGVSDPDEPPMPGPAVPVHGVLLIADLLRTARLDLGPLLEDALRELRRAQTIELP